MSRSELPLFRFYLEQHFRSRQWLAGLVCYVVLFPWGVFFSEDRHSTFLLASVVAAAVALNFGLASDRRSGYALLAANYVSPAATLLWKLCASAVILTGMSAVMLTGALVAWGEPANALWYICRSLLMIWLAMPLALLLEMAVATQFPVVFSGAFIFVIVVTFALQERADIVIAFLGLGTERGAFSSLQRLLVVNLTWNLIVLLVACTGWLFWHRQSRVRVRG